jgi:hypothetical protein
VLHEDWTAAVPAAVLDIVVVGLDLAVLTLKGIGMPSTYSMLDTKRNLRIMTEQARLAETELAPSQPPLDPEGPSPSPASPTGPNGDGPPPRRGRGRPRKTIFNGQTPTSLNGASAGRNGHA